MTEIDWKELQAAYYILTTTSTNRMDSAMWSIYKIGVNIRIDIKG